MKTLELLAQGLREVLADPRPESASGDGRGDGSPSPLGRRFGRWRWHWRTVGLALVLVLFCLPLFVGLGNADFDNDEAIYAFAVDVMIRSGDWLTPRSSPHEEEPFLEKPPLKLWIVAAPIHLGLLPHDEFGQRFWDAVFGGVAFLYVFGIGYRLGGPVAGVLSVLMLFVHRPLVFVHGVRSHNMEAALLLCYSGGVFHFLAWRSARTAAVGRRHALAVALYFVLGFMTKFVAALFLPLVLGAAALLTRDDRARLRRDWASWLAAALLAGALIAPWFVYQYHRVGAELWRTMFGVHVVTRLTTFLDPSHLRPWSYYATELVRQLRWSGTLLVTVAGLAWLLPRAGRRGNGDAVVILVWALVPLALISLLSSKLYHYVYPFLPPLTLAGGAVVAAAGQFVWAVLARPAASTAAVIRTRWSGVPARFGAIVPGIARAGVAAAVVAVLLPIAAYRSNLSDLVTEPHPIRSVRDCLRPIGARLDGPTATGPGVWAEAASLSHAFFYYLHGLGPWQLRDVPSDPTVYMHLYAPEKWRPVLLSQARFDEFMRLVQSGDPDLIDRAARKAGLDASALVASARETHVAQVWFPPDVLMLPGPFSACGGLR